MVSLWYTISPQTGLEKSTCINSANLETSFFSLLYCSNMIKGEESCHFIFISFYNRPITPSTNIKITVETDAPPHPLISGGWNRYCENQLQALYVIIYFNAPALSSWVLSHNLCLLPMLFLILIVWYFGISHFYKRHIEYFVVWNLTHLLARRSTFTS